MPSRRPSREALKSAAYRRFTDFEAEAFWWTQAQMAEALGVDVSNVSRHIKDIFESGELARIPAVFAYFALTAADGKSYRTAHYSLDVFIWRPRIEP